MGKKESNEARMLGIIPSQGADPIPVGKVPDDATQVVKSAGATGSLVLVHEVTAGKTLFLCAASFSVYNHVGSMDWAYFIVTNASDTAQYYFAQWLLPDGAYLVNFWTFLPPLEIPAGWKVQVHSLHGDIYVNGFIHGYEA